MPFRPGDYCDRCNNTGEIDCYCGGDLCVCGCQELPCPQCSGGELNSNNYDPDLDCLD